jgi:glycosyltransferase involved in cell wall biosynthesis
VRGETSWVVAVINPFPRIGNAFGSSIKDLTARIALRTGVRGARFILCVGRVEPRKNQLMLLLALQESDLPVVFADGGFMYQPEYFDMCKAFARKGRTVFTGRLSDELLVSAYRACRLHCLPSWYELPGLVSLEAASYGCTVIASPWGCLPDYLPDGCISVRPTIRPVSATPYWPNQKGKGWTRGGGPILYLG